MRNVKRLSALEKGETFYVGRFRSTIYVFDHVSHGIYWYYKNATKQLTSTQQDITVTCYSFSRSIEMFNDGKAKNN